MEDPEEQCEQRLKIVVSCDDESGSAVGSDDVELGMHSVATMSTDPSADIEDNIGEDDSIPTEKTSIHYEIRPLEARKSHGIGWFLCCCGSGKRVSQNIRASVTRMSHVTLGATKSEIKVKRLTGESLSEVKQVFNDPSLAQRL